MSEWPGYFRALHEATGKTVRDMLKSSTVESNKLIVAGSMELSAEITRAMNERNDEEALRKWKSALMDAKALRAKAQDIPSDSIVDHAWRAMVSPWWTTVLKYSKAKVLDKDLSNMNKNDTIKKFDVMIEFIESRIDDIEEKSK